VGRNLDRIDINLMRSGTKKDLSTRFGMYETDDTAAENSETASISIDFVVPLDLIKEWKRCSIVSDFFANYQSFSFDNGKEAVSILSTITNELLENAIKFSSDKNKIMSLSIRHLGNRISIETINVTNENYAKKMSQFLNKFSEEPNLETAILSQIEHTAENNAADSGVGLMTMISSYDAKLGVKIESNVNDHFYNVYVKVSIDDNRLIKKTGHPT
jgi:hypothetical protein